MGAIVELGSFAGRARAPRFVLTGSGRPVELLHIEEDARGRRALVELEDGTRVVVEIAHLRGPAHPPRT